MPRRTSNYWFALCVLAIALIAGCAPRPKIDPAAALARRVQEGTATPAELVRLGDTYLERGEPLKAAEMAFRARKADPTLVEAHLLLGTVYVAAEEIPKARAAYQEAVQAAPQALAPRLRLARLEIAQGNVGAALTQAQSAIDIDRNSAEAWLLAGKIQRLAKSDGSAGASFRRALSLDPRLTEAQFELGLLAMDHDNYAEAIAPLDQAYQLGERSPVLQAALALALTAGKGDEASYARAEKLLADAAQPELSTAWLAQGLIHQRKREHTLARASYQKVLAANARNERAQYALAMSYREEGNLAAARREIARHDKLVRQRQRLKQLSQDVAARPKDPAAVKAYGMALFEDGNFAAAETQFGALVGLGSGGAEARQWLDRTRARLKAMESAAP